MPLFVRWLLVLTLVTVVHGGGMASKVVAQARPGKVQETPRPPIPTRPPTPDLPPQVAAMRDLIEAAVRSGHIEDLEAALGAEGGKPQIAAEPNDDPIAHWKSVSADGQGREILALLARLLALPPARLEIGRDAENAAVYVWPYLAEARLDALTPVQEVDLYRLMPVAEANAMRARGKWTWYRLVIGADGAWHAFRKFD
jgi:hypothetical protein